MGPLGVPEMMLIFVLALVLFGPKKLPEIGRTLGKAITEFRKASSELKNTFTTEMQNLERETKSIAESTTETHNDSYNYDYSSYQSQYEASNEPPIDITAADPSSESASAPQGAELPLAELPSGELPSGELPSGEAPEGAIARGAEPETPAALAPSQDSARALAHETASTSAEHEA
jgi:sec-independent protein translocase protein TatA